MPPDDESINMPKIPNTLERGDILYVYSGVIVIGERNKRDETICMVTEGDMTDDTNTKNASTIDFTECAWIDHGRLYLSSLYMEEYVSAEVVKSRDELEMFIAYLRQLGDIVFPLTSSPS